MKIYKIENGFLFSLNLEEKELNEYKKKYFHYQKDDMIIFNFDYNKIKPFVLSILKKKGYLEDLNQKLLIMVGGFLLVFVLIFYLFNQNVNKQIEGLRTLIIEKNKNEKNNNLHLFLPNDDINLGTGNIKPGTGTDKKMK